MPPQPSSTSSAATGGVVNMGRLTSDWPARSRDAEPADDRSDGDGHHHPGRLLDRGVAPDRPVEAREAVHDELHHDRGAEDEHSERTCLVGDVRLEPGDEGQQPGDEHHAGVEQDQAQAVDPLSDLVDGAGYVALGYAPKSLGSDCEGAPCQGPPVMVDGLTSLSREQGVARRPRTDRRGAWAIPLALAFDVSYRAATCCASKNLTDRHKFAWTTLIGHETTALPSRRWRPQARSSCSEAPRRVSAARSLRTSALPAGPAGAPRARLRVGRHARRRCLA